MQSWFGDVTLPGWVNICSDPYGLCQPPEMRLSILVESCSNIKDFLDPADRPVLQPYLDAMGMPGGLC